MSEFHLTNWSVTTTPDPWTAPEARRIHLQGLRVEDNRNVVTSPVVAVNGKSITTLSGSIYILEEPNSDYVAWMKDNNIPFDPDAPIRVKHG